jgi:hemerythrin-like metal-binding protein
MPADFIAWSDLRSVGNDELDVQHQTVVAMINDLHAAIGRQAGDTVVASLMDRLLAYTTLHFAHEEKLLQECEFPHLDRHRRLHQKMLAKTRNLWERSLVPGGVSAEELLRFLKAWWTIHVCGEDQEYAPYLQEALAVD